MESKSEATRQKIFEVSLQLFTQKGYGSTTIRDIAQAAHISTGLLFHYFPNKQALLNAHLELAAHGMETVQNLLSSKQAPLTIFASIAQITLTGLRQPAPRLLYLLMSQPLPIETVPKTLQKKLDKTHIITLSEKLIAQGQKQGEIKPGNPRSLAVAFWGAIQGTAGLLAQQPNATIPEPEWLVDILAV